MKRLTLHDVPDDVYDAHAAAAEESRQSLDAFIVERLGEIAPPLPIADHVSAWQPPRGTGVTLDDAVAAVRRARDGAT